MLYMSCPTCGTFLGQKTIQFEINKKKICDDPTILQEDKDIQITELLLSLGLDNYCCKMRFMTYKDIVDIILPIT
jgi:DNA-directed RNA polymerase subunit N (RpoN/RPB10)